MVVACPFAAVPWTTLRRWMAANVGGMSDSGAWRSTPLTDMENRHMYGVILGRLDVTP